MNMPVLVLVGIGIIFGAVSLKEKLTPPTTPPTDSKARTQWVLDQNQKKIEKICKKHKGWC